jgi:hypothetical protein
MLDKIITLTMPNGVGPFVAMIERIGATLGVNAPGAEDGFEGSGYEFAEAIEFLIANGHREDAVWNYTPRQLKAFVALAERRRKRERAEELSLQFLAARGDPKVVKKALKDFER